MSARWTYTQVPRPAEFGLGYIRMDVDLERQVVNIDVRAGDRIVQWTDEHFSTAWRRLLEDPFQRQEWLDEARKLLMQLRYL